MDQKSDSPNEVNYGGAVSKSLLTLYYRHLGENKWGFLRYRRAISEVCVALLLSASAEMAHKTVSPVVILTIQPSSLFKGGWCWANVILTPMHGKLGS